MTQTTDRSARRRTLGALLATAGAAVAGRARAADAYPSRPITFICPWPPGGTADATMRALVAVAGRLLGQPIVFENKAGAAGMLGTKALLAARPDGYTIGQIPLSVNRFAQLGTIAIDPQKDITFIARAVGQTFGIAVRADSPLQTIADVVARAKDKPDALTYATSGIAGQTHIGMESFASAAGIRLNHVPFKGGAEALQAVLGGHVEMLADSSSWAPHVEQGRLRLLATWGEQRLPRFPAVPTLKELGLKVVMNAPNGIGAPRGLEPEVVAKLREAFRVAILSPEYKQACDKLDMVVMYQDADEYRRFVAENWEEERQIIERMKLRELVGKG